MLFSQDIVKSYSRLKAELADLLERQSYELIEPQDGGYPLLVLETPCDSVGFAAMSGNSEPAFTSAYESFKQLYRQKYKVWKDRNLSFVICRSKLDSFYDAFFSSIETDIYFCRKYVICLGHNKDELIRELLRLPFLPLPEGRTGGIPRPPSAQTLLKNLNVSAQLARQIIVPQDYSAIRIVDQLLTQKEPLPAINTSIDRKVQHKAKPTDSTRIRNVEIEAFRAYRKRQEFDVDADVIVLYGPNGLGKTSFFDALDYVCTGRIGRLCRHRIHQNHFMDLARHLGSSVNEGYVSMQVSQGTVEHSVLRDVNDWNTALIGNEKLDRASTLQFLTSAQWEEKKVHIMHLERLFRATHLFGQSDPELLVEFEKNSTLSPDIVHRMLALDDYASGLVKAAAVLDELDKRIIENKQKIFSLNSQEKEVQSRIKELPGQINAVETGKQLREMAASLVKDLQAYISVRIGDVEPSQSSAREWRAMAESTLKDAQDKLRQLQSTESGFAQFTENKSALKRITDELSKIEVVLKEKTIKYRQQQEARKKLQCSLEQKQSDLAQANLRLNALAELGGLQEVFQKTNSSLQKWRLELKHVAGEADATNAELQPLLPVAASLRYSNTELHDTVQSKSLQIQSLSTIQDGLSSWEKNRANIITLQQAFACAQSALHTASTTINELKTRIAAKEKDLSVSEKEYGDQTADLLELTRLLDEIEAYVENGICPTCGIDHKSKAALVESIQAQKQARPTHVETLAKRCGELRKSLKQDKGSLETQTNEYMTKSGELEEMASKLAELRGHVALFEHSVNEAGLPLDQSLTTTVSFKLVEEKAVIQSSQETLTKLESELASIIKRIKELEQKQIQQAETLKRANAAVLPLEHQIVTLRNKADILGLSLEITPDESASEFAVLTSHKAGSEKNIRELISQIQTITQTANEVEKQISEVTEKINSLRQEKERLEEMLRRYEEDAASAIDRQILSLSAISEQRKLATERVDRLDALRKHCITLERTVDAVQRSALLAEFEAQAQSLAKQKQTLAEADVRMSAVRKWFASVKDALDRQSSNAITNHIKAFGPLASLIQKRLRAVYGFGDVELLSKGNDIRVVVGWETKHVEPANYFSDSQKQILMLSLFLAGRLTQTWSGFTPILLDDPVTHFDDLNAFGFVELIRGLVSTSPGKRQFFISTCEDRLFELMLKKFNNMKGGAKFFRFEGIGPDGPIVKKQIIE